MLRGIGIFALVFLFCFSAFGQYSIQVLPPLDPDGSSYAHGINNLGQVVGESLNPDGSVQAVIWENGIPRALDGLTGGVYASAYKINNHGQIAGVVQNDQNTNHAAYWDNAGLIDLGTLGGPKSVARDINDQGVVVGSADLSQHHSSAFTWTKAGGMVDHGNLNPDYIFANAAFNAVNNNGLLVGQGFDFFSPFRAAKESPGGAITDIAVTTGESGSQALGVNDAGVIVGYSNRGSGSVHAAIFDGKGDFQDLGSLDLSDAWAQAINNKNTIVGYAFGSDDEGNFIQKAFIDENGQMSELYGHIPPKTGWEELDSADDVNDLGQIAGWGIYQGEVRAFIISVPEPGVCVVMVIGLMAIRRPIRVSRRDAPSL